MDAGLARGLEAIRQAAATLTRDTPTPDTDMSARLKESLALEAKKFLVYRAYGYRDRQWLSLQRLRALLEMLEETEDVISSRPSPGPPGQS